MLVLGIESSTPVASVALVSQQGLLGETTLNIGLTHSEQLLPLIDDLLRETRLSITDVEGIAVSGGPGSFTGLRIGMATAKGLAQGRSINIVSVPTLQALASCQAGTEFLVAPVMNARRSEVYGALYRLGQDKTEEVIPPQAIAPQSFAKILLETGEKIWLTGDGVVPYLQIWREALGPMALFPPIYAQNARAASVAWLGRERLLLGEKDDLYTLKPFYIRPAEAQVKIKETCQAIKETCQVREG